MIKNIPLKMAVFESGLGVKEIGEKMGRTYTWISKVIHGHVEAKKRDQRKLARVLGTKVTIIFPELGENNGM